MRQTELEKELNKVWFKINQLEEKIDLLEKQKVLETNDIIKKKKEIPINIIKDKVENGKR